MSVGSYDARRYETPRKAILDISQPLTPYLKDRRVTDLCFNPDGRVYLYRRSSREGKLLPEEVQDRFHPETVLAFLETLAGMIGATFTAERPSLDATLPEELYFARVKGLREPVTAAPMMVWRIPPRKRFTLKELVANETLKESEAELLTQRLRERKNIVVVGTTSSGKTALANALVDQLRDERIVVIEDTPELVLKNKNTVNMWTSDGYSTAAALKDSLRMRPDRIIIGELRDGNAVQNYLNSCVSAHPGLCTLHATSESVVSRIYGLVLQETGQPPDLDLIYQSIDYVVQLEQVIGSDGKRRRKVTKITELERKSQKQPGAVRELARLREGDGRDGAEGEGDGRV